MSGRALLLVHASHHGWLSLAVSQGSGGALRSYSGFREPELRSWRSIWDYAVVAARVAAREC